MRRSHAPIVTLTTATLVVVLVACSGPTPPAVLDATAVIPTAAARGETITIAGSGFGTTVGSVSVGGVAATIGAWRATSITANVPAGASNAWQDVTVSTTTGSDTFDGFFVGAEYTGTAADLQAFLDAVEPGTAVLLQAQDYDLSASTKPFVVDSIDLYGRGAANTSITLPNSAMTATGFGAVTTVADLTLRGVHLDFLAGSLRATAATGAVSPTVLPSDAPVPLVVLDGVTFEETASGSFGALLSPPPALDVVIRDSTIDVPTSLLLLITSGDITIEGSVVDAAGTRVATHVGSVNVSSTQWESTSSQWVAETNLSITGSTIRATNDSIRMTAAAASVLDDAGGTSGGPIVISGSVIESLDADLGDDLDSGAIDIRTMFAPITVRDNTLLRSHGDLTVTTLDAVAGEGDIDFSGSGDVRVGVFTSESATNSRQADLSLMTQTSNDLRNTLTLEGNTIAVTGIFQADTGGMPADVIATGNVITAGDDPHDGEVYLFAGGVGVLVATGNTITANDEVWFFSGDLAGGTMVVSDNAISLLAIHPGGVRLEGTRGSCTYTDNTIRADDPDRALSPKLHLDCFGPSPGSSPTMVITGNELVATGGIEASITIEGALIETVTVEDNRFETNSAVEVLQNSTTVSFSRNDVETTPGRVFLVGGAGSSFTVADNTVMQHSPVTGLEIRSVSTASVTGNTFTGVGTPTFIATALSLFTLGRHMTIAVSGNTFSGYERALSIRDTVAGAGFDATISDNVFDFTIDEAPKVAELINVRDAIDARNNQWGSNTDLATVESFVSITNDQGGKILLDPITQP